MLTDIAQLRDALNGLERRMRERRTAFARHLRPGLTDSRIDALTVAMPFRIPDELRAFYNWHDGVTEHERPEWPYFPVGRILAPLDLAVEDYHEWASYEPVPGRIYESSWFPINSLDGRAIVVDCAVGPGEASPLHKVDTHAEWETDCAPSLLHAVRLWNQMLDDGYWVYDESEGAWEDRSADIPERLWNSGLV